MSGRRRFVAWSCVALIGALALPARAQQVTSQRLAAAPAEPQNWLTYSGGYYSQRYSPLNQITPANVKNLKLQWVYQSPATGRRRRSWWTASCTSHSA
jgi:glucose dehydrogenase